MEINASGAQEKVCARFGVEAVPAPGYLKVGIARNIRNGLQPIYGLRTKPAGDTTGWYICAGHEWSEAADFFVPLRAEHLLSWCPQAIPYLQLPPGWRLLIAPDYE